MKTVYRKEHIVQGCLLKDNIDRCYLARDVDLFYREHKNQKFSVNVEVLELSDIEKRERFEKEILSAHCYVDKDGRSSIKKLIDKLRKIRIDFEILEDTPSHDTDIKIVPLEEIEESIKNERN